MEAPADDRGLTIQIVDAFEFFDQFLHFERQTEVRTHHEEIGRCHWALFHNGLYTDGVLPL